MSEWEVTEEAKDMESYLYFKDIVGVTLACLGMKKHTFFNEASSFVKRKLVSNRIRTSQEEIHQAKAAGSAQEGEWIKWKSFKPRSLSWSELWSMEPLMIKFLIRSTYYVLPSPVNMKMWNLFQNDSCYRCHEKGTSEHILNCCPVSLA